MTLWEHWFSLLKWFPFSGRLHDLARTLDWTAFAALRHYSVYLSDLRVQGLFCHAPKHNTRVFNQLLKLHQLSISWCPHGTGPQHELSVPSSPTYTVPHPALCIRIWTQVTISGEDAGGFGIVSQLYEVFGAQFCSQRVSAHGPSSVRSAPGLPPSRVKLLHLAM